MLGFKTQKQKNMLGIKKLFVFFFFCENETRGFRLHSYANIYHLQEYKPLQYL